MGYVKRIIQMVFLSFLVLSHYVIVVIASEPVETREAEGLNEPQFPEQTRALEVITETEYKVDILVDSLDAPWGMDELPDGRLLITQKKGNMVIINTTEDTISTIEGLPEVANGGQGGLLDVAISPSFNEDRFIYFTYAEPLDSGTVTSVGRGKLSADEGMLEAVELLFQALPAYQGQSHYGGRLIFNHEGNILLTTGERSDEGIRESAQSLDNYLGKVILLTPEGEPVETNLFSSDELRGIYTYGHRNVQGIDIHPKTGEIWISEMGPRGGDELNLIQAGLNYGWPLVSYGIEYSGSPVNLGEASGEGFEEPVYYWDPVIAPSGIAFYQSDVIEEWQNNLFIGGLAGMHIARLVIENNIVIGEERLLEEEGQRFRDIISTKDGSLYAITDSGLLYRISIQE